MISKGYVGLFDQPIDDDKIRLFILSWLERFERIEQVCPGQSGGALTVNITKLEDILTDPTPQFRIVMGDDFAWAYLSKGRHVIETTGMPVDEISMCLEVLLELPGLKEVIEQHDDKRLDELEAQGLM